MESLLIPGQSAATANIAAFSDHSNHAKNPGANSDSLIIQNLAKEQGKKGKDNYQKIYDSLSFTAQKVIEKLDTYLAEYVPGGVKSLDPVDHTSEKTAERIVKQVTALFAAYEKQNPDLEPEELINGFMEQARNGVDQGYGEAFEILEGIGAFEIEGVQSGVEKTKELIDEKLNNFEKYLAKHFGLEDNTEIETPVKNDLLAQGGAHVLDVTA